MAGISARRRADWRRRGRLNGESGGVEGLGRRADCGVASIGATREDSTAKKSAKKNRHGAKVFLAASVQLSRKVASQCGFLAQKIFSLGVLTTARLRVYYRRVFKGRRRAKSQTTDLRRQNAKASATLFSRKATQSKATVLSKPNIGNYQRKMPMTRKPRLAVKSDIC